MVSDRHSKLNLKRCLSENISSTYFIRLKGRPKAEFRAALCMKNLKFV
ncbi:hypothetical protein HMPREF9370_1828 [Neisseria wadsworthii 9715]|uniref:Uncharacterized protein n=1 Tax=Neisseria wadsworthii 9715 TaxID=1030841 RepID=G4CRW8_9NEIS|nr:hypothetical protein HMPREF9370_1828 [Neisseria wadsworthii 9715]